MRLPAGYQPPQTGYVPQMRSQFTRYAGSANPTMPMGAPATSSSYQPWKPDMGTTPQSVNLGSLFGGGGGGYQGPTSGGWTHNQQPNYFPYQWGGGLSTNPGGGGGIGNAWGNDNASGPSGGSGGSGGGWWSGGGYNPSSGGGGGGPLGGLINSVQGAQDASNKANNDRYNNILQGREALKNNVLAQVQGIGQQQKQDLQRQYDRNAASMDAGLINRGMANTTVRDTMNFGNERERNQAANRLQDELTRENVNYQTSLSEPEFQFMERRTDKGPDFGQYLGIAQAMGLGGVGYGGGGGSGGMSMGGGFDYMPAGALGYGPNAGAMMGWGGGGQGPRALTPFQQQLLAQNVAKQQGQQFWNNAPQPGAVNNPQLAGGQPAWWMNPMNQGQDGWNQLLTDNGMGNMVP
jgi:hypothetical protein